MYKGTEPESNHKEVSGKPKLRDILQNNWSVTFNSFKFMKVLKRLRNLFQTGNLTTKCSQ